MTEAFEGVTAEKLRVFPSAQKLLRAMEEEEEKEDFIHAFCEWEQQWEEKHFGTHVHSRTPPKFASILAIIVTITQTPAFRVKVQTSEQQSTTLPKLCVTETGGERLSLRGGNGFMNEMTSESSFAFNGCEASTKKDNTNIHVSWAASKGKKAEL